MTAVEVRREGEVHRLTLNRPTAGNAIDQPLADAFAAAVHAIVAEPEPQIVVLSAEGTQFCAGGDVRAVATAEDPAAYLHRLAATMHDALRTLRRGPHTVVAAVQGAAAGAGLALVLHADIVIASERAMFLSAYAGVGLTPDCGVSRLLPRTVGPRRATELCIAGRVLDATEARDWGLVNTVVPDGELAATTEDLVARLAAGPAWAQSRTLALLRREDLDLSEQLDAELDGLGAQIALPDTRELMARLLARSERKGSS